MSVHNYSEIFQKIKEELSNIRDRKEKKEKKGKIIWEQAILHIILFCLNILFKYIKQHEA